MSELTTIPDVEDAADEVARLEAEIASKRVRLAGSLDELRNQWQGATSWRRVLSSGPVVWMGVGLCLGIAIGYAVSPSRRRR